MAGERCCSVSSQDPLAVIKYLLIQSAQPTHLVHQEPARSTRPAANSWNEVIRSPHQSPLVRMNAVPCWPWRTG